ncbi:hypothetical protein [Terriglobus sp. RCC_193]|uniref:hypothetical protein n=1 Tax=Terriglobus sp. RCC_193 TaxID=3239218 RepID=UPI003524F3A1
MSESVEIERKSLKVAKLSAWVSAAGFIAAILSVYFVYQTLEDANKNFQADKRPWIGVELPLGDKSELKVFDEIQAGQKIEWVLPWKNYGNSPALDVHERLELLLTGPGSGGWDGTVDWRDVQNKIETLSMPPEVSSQLFNGQILPGHGASDTIVDQVIADRVNAGLQRAILGGRVIYYDEFQNRHETTVCVRYVAPGEGHPAGWTQCPLKTIAD